MRCFLGGIKFFKRLEDSIGAGIYAHGRDVGPANDSVAVDDEQRPLTGAMFAVVDAIMFGHLALGLKIREEGKVQLAVVRIGRVTPDAIDGNAQELRLVAIELVENFVVEGKLI